MPRPATASSPSSPPVWASGVLLARVTPGETPAPDGAALVVVSPAATKAVVVPVVP
jgi:hypothetical protein